MSKKKPTKRSASDVLCFFERMCDNNKICNEMSDIELSKAAIDVWMEYPINSLESCVLEEIIHRFREAKGIKTKED